MTFTIWSTILGCSLFTFMACKNAGATRLLTKENGSPTDEDIGGSVRSRLFPVDWQPGHQVKVGNETHGLTDFSYAGYGGRMWDQPLSEEVVVEQLVLDKSSQGSRAPSDWNRAHDISDHLEKAVAKVKKFGKPAIIQIPEGRFRISRQVRIDADGILLKGAGTKKTFIYLVPPQGILNFAPKVIPWYQEVKGGDLVDHLEKDRFTVTVEDASKFKIGDEVAISWKVTRELAEEFNSLEWWSESRQGGSPLVGRRVWNFRRSIRRINGNVVTVDSPWVMDVRLRDKPRLDLMPQVLREVGMQDLSVSSAYKTLDEAWPDPDPEPNPGPPIINFDWVRHVVVRNIDTFGVYSENAHLASMGLALRRAFNVTVENVHLSNAQNLGGGGRGYLFMLGGVNDVLIQDSSGIGGRHNLTFVGDLNNSRNVISGFVSRGGRVCRDVNFYKKGACSMGPVDTHEPLAIANLIENSTIDDGIFFGNRQELSGNVGQTATLNVLWRIKGEGKILSYNTGKGYVIGTSKGIKVFTAIPKDGVNPQTLIEPVSGKLSKGTGPEDYVELLGQGDGLHPVSLYSAQKAYHKKN
jgi:hypothetical protein